MINQWEIQTNKLARFDAAGNLLKPDGSQASVSGGGSLGLAGNGLVNFSDKSLTHGTVPHKTIFYIGNSTVWNASEYYTELLQYFVGNNELSKLGLLAPRTDVAGYQALDSAGNIRITLNAAVSAEFAVGDLVLSQPSNPALNTMIGTGVITAIGATTIDYRLVSGVAIPGAGAYTTSGGVLSNCVVNLGQNGATCSATSSAIIPILSTYAKPGDLVSVRGPLINDVRQGSATLAQATASVSALLAAIVAAVPATVDIYWKTENSLLTTDPTATGHVSPLGLSAAYSKILQQAVVNALTAAASRAVFADMMQIVYSKLGQEYATSSWMGDILHPSQKGRIAEAGADIQILASIVSGRGLPSFRQLSDPNGNTGGNGASVGGMRSTLDSFRTLVGFSAYLASHAMANNYGAPWTLYPDVVLDPDRFTIIQAGSLAGFGANYIRFNAPAVNGVNPGEYQVGDVLWFLGGPAFQLLQGFAATAFNLGGAVYGVQLGGLTGLPQTIFQGQQCAVFRANSLSYLDVPYSYGKDTFPYRHSINVVTSGNGFLRVSFIDGTPSWPTAITQNDVIFTPAGKIALTGASIHQFSTYVQINLAGAWGAWSGTSGYIFGNHASEGAFGAVTTPQLYGLTLTTRTTPPTLASAATISPNSDVAFVSGTTQINNIAPPSNFTGAGGGGGCITLVPTGLWSTNTTGNIALATIAVVGKALSMYFDSASAKWYPSY